MAILRIAEIVSLVGDSRGLANVVSHVSRATTHPLTPDKAIRITSSPRNATEK